MRISTVLCGVALSAAMCGRLPAAEIVFENARIRAILGEDAAWRSLIDKTSGEDFCAGAKHVPFAAIRVDGNTQSAAAATMSGERLTVDFDGCRTRLVYAVTRADDWIAFQLVGIDGPRPSHATLLQFGTTICERGGPRLNAAWNDRYAVCLRTTSLQSHGSVSKRSDHTLLGVVSQDAPGPRLEGAGAAILAAPPAELKPILARFSAAFDLPRNEEAGVASKDLAIARQSYWFLSFAESDVDKVIDYCRQAGFRQVMLNCGSWCASVGHFTFKTDAYPDGIESLRRTVARLHENGILVGMHAFASKVSKSDPYVTPVPNRGFCVDMSATLAEDVDAEATAIRTGEDLSQWPGSPACRQKVWEGHVSKHQEVIIEDEIICYEAIGPDGRWDTFLGCQRGAWGTRATAHAAATQCRHWAVDGCINGYILDQEAPLFEETTSRLAQVFNECGFEMVYFDGSEDVDRRRYDYYASNAHAVAMGKFSRRPLIHMGGGLTHGLWHSFTRSATIDQYPGTYLAYLRAGGSIDDWPTCKDHIDRSVGRVVACEEEMIPGELGWFGIGPKSGQYDGLQFDEIEYLMCKSLAYNAPISLQTSFARMEAHPLTPDVLAIVRRYEGIRLASSVPPASCERLKQQGRDFLMLPAPLENPGEPPVFVEVAGPNEVAGTHDVRAFVGQHGDDAIAALWHYLGKDGKLLLDVPRVEAYDVRGGPVAVGLEGVKTVVPVDSRRLVLRFAGMSADAVRTALAAATLELRKPAVLWIQAEDGTCVGAVAKGTAAGISDPEALADYVLPTGRIDRTGQTPCYCEYHVAIPRKGRWTLWARVRYPGGGDQSFGLVLGKQEVTLAGDQVLGNCGRNGGRWHWTGRGGGVSTVAPGSPIALTLPRGEVTIHIYAREGPGTPGANPQLDCLCLADDPDYRPTDADARAGLAAKPSH